jgi:hypothetical protein
MKNNIKKNKAEMRVWPAEQLRGQFHQRRKQCAIDALRRSHDVFSRSRAIPIGPRGKWSPSTAHPHTQPAAPAHPFRAQL